MNFLLCPFSGLRGQVGPAFSFGLLSGLRGQVGPAYSLKTKAWPAKIATAKRRLARLSEQARREAEECAKVASMPVQNQHAAVIDVGDLTHWVCVNSAPEEAETVREFRSRPVYVQSLHLCHRLVDVVLRNLLFELVLVLELLLQTVHFLLELLDRAGVGRIRVQVLHLMRIFLEIV